MFNIFASGGACSAGGSLGRKPLFHGLIYASNTFVQILIKSIVRKLSLKKNEKIARSG
jgi:hypothetical protein